MQIEHVPSMESAPHFVVTLEGEQERALTNDQLARMAANCAGVEWDYEAGQYRLDGRPFGAPVEHATVTRSGDRVAIVAVSQERQPLAGAVRRAG